MFNKEDFQKMYNYCLGLTKDEDEAYDLLQSALEKFYKKKGEQLEYPVSYLYRIIKNHFIDIQRRKSRWKMDDIEEDKNNIHLIAQNNVLDELVSKEETEQILGVLKPDERELLFLWAVEGYTVQAISEQFDSPKGTILSKLHRVKKKLRESLKDNEYRKYKRKTKTS